MATVLETETTTTTTPETTTRNWISLGETLKAQTVILHAVFHCPSFSKRDRSKQVQTDGDQNRYKVLKSLIDSPLLKALKKVGTDFNLYVGCRESKAYFARAFHAITLPRLPEILETLKSAMAEFATRKREFLEAYPALKRESRDALQDGFREEDFPSLSRLESTIYAEFQLLDFNPPESGKLSDVVEWESIERSKEWWGDAAREVMADLRATALQLTQTLSEKLAPRKVDGSTQRLNKAAIDAVCEFCAGFDKMNILGDDSLKACVSKLRNIAGGINVEELRPDTTGRKLLKAEVDKIGGVLDSLVEEIPSRRFAFGDDED